MFDAYYSHVDEFFDNQYTRLLIAEICLILIPTLVPKPWSDLASVILETLVIVIILQILKTRRSRFYTYLVVSLLVFALELVDFFSNYVARTGGVVIDVIAGSTHIIFSMMAIIVILRKIFSQRQMTSDSVRGGVAVYLLLGFTWYFGYRMLYSLDPTSFQLGKLMNSDRELAYFSFVTLTTVGYGDITPQTQLAMAVAVLEALMGQMYPAVIISCLISQYISSLTQPRP